MRLVLGAASLLACLLACGTDAVGVESCRKIEHARCRWAVPCGVNVDVPVRRAKGTSPVDDCYRHYDDACLHGLPVADPGEAAVSGCIEAIDQGDCAIVKKPELAPACGWLIPPPDAGAEGATEDAPEGG